MSKIKICGIRRIEDIEIINKYNPDYIGFIFAESKRKISKEFCKELVDKLNSNIKTVGVFVNETADNILKIADYCNLDIVQLHGEESIEDCKIIGEYFEVWKAFSVKSSENNIREKLELNLEKYKNVTDLYLLDAYSKVARGGTGEVFNWDIVSGLNKKYRIALAGGITPKNIVEAINLVNPEIIDISSGVETDGYKNEEKIKELINKTGVRKMERKFGEFGGQYVAETMMNPLLELERAYEKAKNDPDFIAEYKYYLKEYVGRETPLFYAKKLTEKLGGAKIYLKREDLNHTGAHKINNVLGQILLAKRMGKKKIIAETGAGQHGVATATGAALFGLECEVFMGAEDMERQKINVFRMELLGAKVTCVTSGTATLKDATNEAIRQWIQRIEDTFYIIGSVVGPHPYPTMVRDFQKIIGEETKIQILKAEGRLPDAIIACVGGGSNAMGMFYDFIKDEGVKLYGVEAGGLGIETNKHAAAFAGKVGVIHGMKTYMLCDEEGNITPAHSVSAGLDYPGVGPEHAHLFDIKRVKYDSVTDTEALEGFKLLTLEEGIIPALESAHAIAFATKLAPTMGKDEILVINISGRGDKDIHTVAEYLGGNK